MDPNENLREQRALSMRLLEQLELPAIHEELLVHDVIRLIELRNALDEWLTKGGALPAQWGRRQ